MDEVLVKFSDETDAPEKMKEECCPGQPYISFFSKPGIDINFINPVPFNSMLSRVIKISPGDSVSKICNQLTSEVKEIKGK